MRILFWHGYLLGGTGSNVYTRAVAREWSRAGHDVTIVCQERQPGQFDLGSARVVVPELPDGLLPVFVLDRYEGLDARLLGDFAPEQRARYVEANAAALRELLPADLVFANHVVLGGPVAAATGARYAVYAHGSELEYSMRGNPELERWGRESLAGAHAVFVGSGHIRRVLEDVVGHVERVHEVPPRSGRDPVPAGAAGRRARRAAGGGEGRSAEPRQPRGAASGRGQCCAVRGVLRHRQADRPLLREADREQGRAGAVRGAAGTRRARRHRRLRRLRETLEAEAPPGTLFTGPLEHRHLAHLLPLCDVAAVPSIFPEAFGMVAAEAASAGVPPVVAEHSGLAEVAAGLGREYPPGLEHVSAFATGDADSLRQRSSPRSSRSRRRSAASSAPPPAAPSSATGAGPALPSAF